MILLTVGPLPSELGQLTNLKDLWLYGNRLSGTSAPKSLVCTPVNSTTIVAREGCCFVSLRSFVVQQYIMCINANRVHTVRVRTRTEAASAWSELQSVHRHVAFILVGHWYAARRLNYFGQRRQNSNRAGVSCQPSHAVSARQSLHW